MSEVALAFPLPNPEENKSKDSVDERTLKKRIKDTYTEELIIGLCGPVGTDIHYVATEIGAIIKEKYSYEVEIIRLSDFIQNHTNVQKTNNHYQNISNLINAGNHLRSEKGNSVLAELAINEIAIKRELKRKGGDFKSNRICYVIDSIKNNEELELFRLIYSNLFYFIGVFSSVEVREKNLENKGLTKPEVYQLIDRDSGEELDFGQKVSDTFVQSDFFLRIEQSTSATINYKIARYLSLIFNSDIVTPTSDETAMYQAFAAAGNSACLSRQVGASITNSKGEIISIGWNDVPKYNGGVYTTIKEDILGSEDFRCINLHGGVCFNDIEKDLIRNLLVDKLMSQGLIKKEDMGKVEDIIKKSRIKELIEFSRAVHAEMHAIIIGSQKSGHDVIGGKLYCTTYPCHNCARHIIAAGIKDVYYIEPYRKSLAIKLHDDAISEKENDDGKKVRVLMFDGVSPRRYLDLFKMMPNSRKENGKKKKTNMQQISPKNTVSLQAIPILEKEIIKELKKKHLIEV
ncbi:MAG: cytidine/deoxycytidylate deaminase family protein [Flavipsychrobacter sp.]|jgi:deoxycytidylate deaminase|nr:cytidine/deoxycytidylate deaminase family protein [Flavipsychrobacter sp.]